MGAERFAELFGWAHRHDDGTAYLTHRSHGGYQPPVASRPPCDKCEPVYIMGTRTESRDDMADPTRTALYRAIRSGDGLPDIRDALMPVIRACASAPGGLDGAASSVIERIAEGIDHWFRAEPPDPAAVPRVRVATAVIASLDEAIRHAGPDGCDIAMDIATARVLLRAAVAGIGPAEPMHPDPGPTHGAAHVAGDVKVEITATDDDEPTVPVTDDELESTARIDVWARAFMQRVPSVGGVHTERGLAVVDEGTILGWLSNFAAAIDRARRADTFKMPDADPGPTDPDDPVDAGELLDRMDAAIAALAIAVEGPIWDDVNGRWQALRTSIVASAHDPDTIADGDACEWPAREATVGWSDVGPCPTSRVDATFSGPIYDGPRLRLWAVQQAVADPARDGEDVRAVAAKIVRYIVGIDTA